MFRKLSSRLYPVLYRIHPSYPNPQRYQKIDNYLSRSAQPNRANFIWLMGEGVTDVIDLRGQNKPDIDFKEPELVTKLGMRYHNIQIDSKRPDESKIKSFFDLMEEVRGNKRAAHIHCWAGVDRTGFFALLYKSKYNIDTLRNNIREMIKMGHYRILSLDTIPQAKRIISQFR